MTSFLQLLLSLAVIIAAAKVGGYISFRLGQPSVLGELIVGIILGPTVLNLLHLPFITDEHLPEVIHHLAELGVLFLMFLAGLELHLSDLAKSGKISAFGGILGVIVPLGLGALVSYYYIGDQQSALFIGLILAATSVSISAQTLMELKVLRSRVGVGLLGAAVFDDILVVLGLSLFTAVVVSGGSLNWLSIAWIALKMVLFLGIGAVLGFWLLPRASESVSRLQISQGLTVFSLAVMILYGWSAEILGGMASITGAFLAGLILSRSPLKERIESSISVLAFGFFVPIFFIDIGLSTNLRDLVGPTFWFFVVISVVAIIGKVLGAGFGGLLGGLSRRESLQLGIGMISRGEVGLIVASIGILNGLIDQAQFSAIVGVVIITTLLTPLLLRSAFKTPSKTPPKKPEPEIPDQTPVSST